MSVWEAFILSSVFYFALKELFVFLVKICEHFPEGRSILADHHSNHHVLLHHFQLPLCSLIWLMRNRLVFALNEVIIFHPGFNAMGKFGLANLYLDYVFRGRVCRVLRLSRPIPLQVL